MASGHSWLSAFSTRFQLISALLLRVSLLVHVDAQNPSAEVATLLAFKAANQPYSDVGYFETWKETDKDPCAWLGVICADINHTVSDLALSGWGLSNSSSLIILSNLTRLRQLDLSSNSLDVIPDYIGVFTGLILLDLSRNYLSNEIPPSISACKSLRSLSLQGNRLSGWISNLRGLVKLQILSLADNALSGPVKDLRELRGLVVADLSGNSFNGTIPALPNLTNLFHLKLDNNRFTAFENPWLLAENATLTYLSVSLNQLEGPIPSSITNLRSLTTLNMTLNRLSGPIPSGFSRLLSNNSNAWLDLSQNQLTGIPPDMFQQLNSFCHFFNLSYNLLTGSIPMDRARRSCFSYLDLSHNNLSGPIPPNTFSDEGVIFALWLQNNHLSGDIVDVIVERPGFAKTIDLRLQNNIVTGDLSRIANSNLYAGNLDGLDLRNNDIRWSTSQAIPDPIRATLEKFPGLGEFRVGGNNFSGTSLPRTCFVDQSFVSYLAVLDLSNSHLKGNISGTFFGNSCLSILEILDLSNNDIDGPVPESIVTLPFLISFDVSNNNLSGPLPPIPIGSTLFNRSIFVATLDFVVIL